MLLPESALFCPHLFLRVSPLQLCSLFFSLFCQRLNRQAGAAPGRPGAPAQTVPGGARTLPVPPGSRFALCFWSWSFVSHPFHIPLLRFFLFLFYPGTLRVLHTLQGHPSRTRMLPPGHYPSLLCVPPRRSRRSPQDLQAPPRSARSPRALPRGPLLPQPLPVLRPRLHARLQCRPSRESSPLLRPLRPRLRPPFLQQREPPLLRTLRPLLRRPSHPALQPPAPDPRVPLPTWPRRRSSSSNARLSLLLQRSRKFSLGAFLQEPFKQSHLHSFQQSPKSSHSSIPLKPSREVSRRLRCKRSRQHIFRASPRSSSSRYALRLCPQAPCKGSPRLSFRLSSSTLRRRTQKTGPRSLPRCCTRSPLPSSLTSSPSLSLSPVQTQSHRSVPRTPRVPLPRCPLKAPSRVLRSLPHRKRQASRRHKFRVSLSPSHRRSHGGSPVASHGSCARDRLWLCPREPSLAQTACRTARFRSCRPRSRSRSPPSTRCSQTMRTCSAVTWRTLRRRSAVSSLCTATRRCSRPTTSPVWSPIPSRCPRLRRKQGLRRTFLVPTRAATPHLLVTRKTHRSRAQRRPRPVR